MLGEAAWRGGGWGLPRGTSDPSIMSHLSRAWLVSGNLPPECPLAVESRQGQSEAGSLGRWGPSWAAALPRPGPPHPAAPPGVADGPEALSCPPRAASGGGRALA